MQRTLLADSPDIVVATPARAAQNIQNSALLADNLTCLVIDEADLVLSYGYEDDLQTISKAMPKDLQTILLSATLTPEVNTLNELFCQDPTIIDIQEKPQEDEGVSQYIVRYVLCICVFGYGTNTEVAQVRRRRQILTGVCDLQAAAYQGQVYHFRRRYR